MLLQVFLLLSSFLVFAATAAFAAPDWAVTIDDTGYDPTPAGGTIVYSVSVDNQDFDDDAPATTISFDVPIDTTMTGVSLPGANCTGTGGVPLPVVGPSVVTCDVPALPAGTGVDFTVDLVPDIQQTVNFVGSVPLGPGEASTSNNSSTQPTTVQQGADIELTIAGPTSAASGSTVSYTFTVDNNGPGDANGVEFTFPVPAGLENIVPPPGCTLSSGAYVCVIPDGFVAGDSEIFVFEGQVSASDGSTVTPSASVASTASPDDGVSSNNVVTLDTDITAGSDLNIGKSISNPSPLVGDTVTFTISPSFTGDNPNGLLIIDNVPSNYQVSSVVGAPWNCSATVGNAVSCSLASGSAAGANVALGDITIEALVITASDPAAVANQVEISAAGPTDPDHSNNTADDGGVVIEVPTVDHRANKSGPSPALVAVGSEYSYQISSTNLGNAGFYGTLVMVDTLPFGLTLNTISENGWTCDQSPVLVGPATIRCELDILSSDPLEPGETAPAVTTGLLVTEEGALTNSLTVSAEGANIVDVENANDTITYGVTGQDADTSPDVTIVKTRTESTLASGEVQTFTIEVINNGPFDPAAPSTSALGVEITDTIYNLINDSVGPNDGYISHVINAAGNSAGMTCSTVSAGGNARELSCDIASLPECSAGSCPMVTVMVRPGGNAATRFNTAEVQTTISADSNETNNSSAVSYQITPQADVTVSKTATPSPTAVGQDLVYIVTAANQPEVAGIAQTLSTATNVTITDTLPLDVTFVSASPSSGSCSLAPAAGVTTTAGDRTVECNLGSLLNGAQRTVTIIVRPNNALIGSSLTNNVAVATDTPETNNTNNTASVVTPTTAPAFDLLVNKTDDIDPLAVGDDVTYNVVIANLGPSAAENVVLVDNMPGSFIGFQSYSAPVDATCSNTAGTPTTNPNVGPTSVQINCSFPYLAAGESRTVTIVGRGHSKGTATNNADVSGDGSAIYETNMTNNDVDQLTTVRTRVDVRVNSKTPSLPTVNIGDDFTYAIEIENVADIGLLFGEADDVEVSDNLPSGMILTGTPSSPDATCTGSTGGSSFVCDFGTMFTGQISTITVPVRVTTVDADPDSFTNTAEITTSSRDTDTDNNTGLGVVEVLSSSISGEVFRDFNDDALITSSTDTGVSGIQMTLTGTDSNGNSVNLTTTTNGNGEYSFEFLEEGTYTVTRGTISEAYQTDGTNTAGTGGANYTPLTSPSISLGDDEDLPDYLFAIIPQARIALAKEVSGTTMNADGTFDVTFSFVIENFSLEALQNVVVADPLSGATPLFGTYVASPVAMPRGSYTILTSPSTACGGAIAGYTGDVGNVILVSGAYLAAGTSCTATFTLRGNPTDPFPTPLAGGEQYVNSANVDGEGVLSGQTSSTNPLLSDVSDDGAQPDADGDGSGDDLDEDTPTPVTINFTSTIELIKEVDTGALSSPPLAGEILSYTYTVQNTGSYTVYDIAVTDSAPGFSGTGTPVPTPSSASGGANLGGNPAILDLAPGGAPITYTATYAITQADIIAGFVQNTATATGTDVYGESLSDVSDDPTETANVDTEADGDPDDPTVAPLTYVPQLTTVKSFGTSVLNADGTVIVPVTITVTNSGNVDIDDLQISDNLALPANFGTAFRSVTVAPSISVNDDGNLATAVLPSANVTAFDGDAQPLILAGSDGLLGTGDSVTAVFTVLVDPNDPSAPATLDNLATGSGNDPSDAFVSDDSGDVGGGPGDPTVLTPPTEVGTIGLVKSSVLNDDDGVAGVSAGDSIDYTYVVTNTSTTVNVYNVGVSEPNDASNDFTGTGTPIPSPAYSTGGADLDSGAGTATDIAPGDTVTFTASYIITQADVDAGNVDNSAVASGTDPSGYAPSDTSDSGNPADGDGTGTPGSGPNDDEVTVTPLGQTPQIGVSKAAGTPSLNADGTFDVVYTLVMQNTGNVTLDDLTLVDDLATQFGSEFTASDATTTTGGIIVAPVATLTTNASGLGVVPTADTGYDGTAGLLDGASGVLGVDDVVTVTFTARIDPNQSGTFNAGPYNNTATAGGDDPSGVPTTDVSDTGSDPTGNPGEDTGTPTPVTPPGTDPEIGVSKAAGTPSLNADGTFDVVYTLVMQNTGDVTLDDLTLVDDLASQFGSEFTASDATTTTGGIIVAPVATLTTNASGLGVVPTADTGYDGTAGLLDGASGVLGVDDVVTVTFTARIDPNQSGTFNAGPYNNTATAGGDDPSGVPTTDVSDTGSDPTGNPGEDTGTPTPVTPPGTDPEIGVSKAAGTPSLNADGTFDVVYTLVMQNTGDVTLDDLTLVDDLASQFGSEFTASDATTTTGGIIVAPVATLTTNASGLGVVPTADTGYDGTAGLLDGASGVLGVDDVVTVTFTARIDPNQSGTFNAGPYNNTATAGGDDPSGVPTTDVSDTGSDPTGNPGEDTGTPTPVTPPGTDPEIGVSKAAGTPSLNADGTFDVVYTLVMQNTGDVTLDDLTLVDDLASQFGSEFTASDATTTTGGIIVAPVATLTTNASGLGVVPTADTGYDGTAGLLDGASGVLGVDDVVTVTFTARIDPNQSGTFNAGPYNNTATAGGDDPSGVPTTDVSDTGSDPTGNPGEDTGTPTPVTPPGTDPEIGVSKAAGTPSLNADGTFDVVYTLVMQNTGDVTLDDLTLVDDLASQFGSEFTASDATTTTGGIIVAPVATLTTNASGLGVVPTADTGYDGTAGLLDGASGVLGVDDVVTVTFTARIDPNQSGTFNAGPYNNTATAGGDDPSGVPTTDVSDTGSDPTGNPGEDTGTPTPVAAPTEVGTIGLVKSSVLNDDDGVAGVSAGDSIDYTYVVTNTSTTVNVYNVGVSEPNDASNDFTGTGTPIPSPAYSTGGADLDSGAGTATDIAPGDTVTFTASYIITQADVDAGNVDNSAVASGTDPSGYAPSDTSDSGNPADGDGTGTPGSGPNDDEVTVTPLPQTRSMELEKSLVSVEQVFPYTYDLVYEVAVINTGNSTETGIRVQDDLSSALSPATIVGIPTVSIANFTGTPSANALYDGASSSETLSGNPTLAPTEIGLITITVRMHMAAGYPTNGNTANGSSDDIAGPIPSDAPAVTPGDDSDTNPTPPPVVDADGDGAPDGKESDIDDRDGDGIPDASDYDPTGYFYCEEDGRILSGGLITVTGPFGSQIGVGTGSNITIVRDGADGSFQWYTTAPGTYTMSYALPTTGVASVDRLPGATIDLTSFLPTDPASLGSSEFGSTGNLADFTASANPFSLVFDIEENDPSLLNVNIPLRNCGSPEVTAAKSVAVPPILLSNGVTQITYEVSVESTGTIPVNNVTLVDDLDAVFGVGNHVVTNVALVSGPAGISADLGFNGSSNTNLLILGSSLQPGEIATVQFTAEISVASAGSYTNSVVAGGLSPVDDSPITESTAGVDVEFTPPGGLKGLVVTKVANVSTARIGDVIGYTITIANDNNLPWVNVSLVDFLPAGFTYRPNTAQIGGVDIEPVQSGRKLTWSGQTIPANSTVTLTLSVGVGPAASASEFINEAWVEDPLTETIISNKAKAIVRREVEHVFDCGEIIGKVFDDVNRNGVQDEDKTALPFERGLPGVRLATVNGVLITTDKHGRFNVPCAAIPDANIGSNFILKLDPRTLPTGYSLTTENPRVVRLTRGKLTKLNFGASIGQVVRIQLSGKAFVAGSVEPSQSLLNGLNTLAAKLEADEQSILKITYTANGEGNSLAKARMQEVRDIMHSKWSGFSNQNIETRIVGQ